jgi:hypothetical protein
MYPDLEIRQLRDILTSGSNLVCVHYACENFNQVKDRPAAISCVAIYRPVDNGIKVFSLKTFATVGGAPRSRWSLFQRFVGGAPEMQHPGERRLLEAFYEELRNNSGTPVIHWNMNTALYGFTALASRYEFLTGQKVPYNPPPSQLHDLDAVMARRYGDNYAHHPKLKFTAELNSCNMRSFLSGAEEAQAFADRDYGRIELSTSRKASIIGHLLTRLCAGQLRTLTSAGTVEFANEHLDAVQAALQVGSRLRAMARSLRHRRKGKPPFEITDEYDFQDLFRTVLNVFFDDIREEEVTPTHAGASSRIDFWLPEFALGIELKLTRSGLGDKEVGEQLIVDRDRYKARAGIKHLVCLVLDPDSRVDNPRGLESDLSRDTTDEGMAVTVRIYES